jgi:hypothetical protein
MPDDEEPPLEAEEENAADGLMPAQPGLTAVAGAGVALAPLAAYGPIGAAFAAVLTPAVAAILQGAVYEWTQVRAQRAAKMLKNAADYARVDVEDFLRKIGSDPIKLALLSDTMQAASVTNLDRKIRLLGTALAEGVLAADDALIEEKAILVAAVADLEEPHLQVLKIIADGTKRTGYMGAERQGISEMDIARSRRGLEGYGGTSLLQPLLRVLDRNGLIYQTRAGEVWDENMADDIRPSAGSNEWAATRFAQSLLLTLLDSR